MREERTIHLAEIPIGGQDGLVWNRLHTEREEICERILKEPVYIARQILQTRLRKVDDALDRVMSGSYGYCSRCGRAIDSTRLESDPTSASCRDCRKPESRTELIENFAAALVS
jgi:hypothetical protein